MDCLSPEQMARYLRGGGNGEARAVEAHVRDCPAGAMELLLARETLHELKVKVRPATDRMRAVRGKRSTWMPWTAAAAVMFVAILVFALRPTPPEIKGFSVATPKAPAPTPKSEVTPEPKPIPEPKKPDVKTPEPEPPAPKPERPEPKTELPKPEPKPGPKAGTGQAGGDPQAGGPAQEGRADAPRRTRGRCEGHAHGRRKYAREDAPRRRHARDGPPGVRRSLVRRIRQPLLPRKQPRGTRRERRDQSC